MSKSRNRRPKASPSAGVAIAGARVKVPKLQALRVHENDHPRWRLSLVDTDGPWGWDKAGAHMLDILEFLKQMEKLTWKELQGNRTGSGRRTYSHRFIPQGSLIPAAQKRLRELGLDDYDDLFRFRLAGAKRLWGVLEDDIFYPIWWDPEHEICP